MMKRLFPFRAIINVNSRKTLALFLCLLFTFSLFAQSRKDLERQKKQKENEISLTRKLLAEKTQKQKQTVEYLGTLNQQIKARQELIGTYQNEVHLLNLNITDGTELVDAMEGDIESIKEEYAKLLYFSYKNESSYKMMAFVFSAGNFKQAWHRMQLLRYYSAFRKSQVGLIKRTQQSLSNKITDLRQQREEKAKLLADINEQKKAYEADKSEQTKLVAQLKGEEKKLRKQLADKQKAAQKLDVAIKQAIEREIAKNRKKKAAPTASTDKTTAALPALTPEALKLSGEFATNRSKLPWPVERGVISGQFGKQNHPTIPNIIVENKGIKIRTTQGSLARAIFDGEVTSIVKIPGSGKAVLINHGEYYSVYGYLEDVQVKPGDKIKAKQELGTISKDIDSGSTELELQIWKNNERLNPSQWLAR